MARWPRPTGVSAGITAITGTMGSRTDKDFVWFPEGRQTLSVSMTGPNDHASLYLVNASGTQLRPRTAAQHRSAEL